VGSEVGSMKVIKEGEVIFRDGKLAEINNFEVDLNDEEVSCEHTGADILREYVEKRYRAV